MIATPPPTKIPPADQMPQQRVSVPTKLPANKLYTLFVLCVLFLAIILGSFMAGYSTGLNRVRVPFISSIIRMPELERFLPKQSRVVPLTEWQKLVAMKDAPVAPDNMRYLLAYTGATLDKTTLESKYVSLKFAPYAEESLSFKVVCPADWHCEPPKLKLAGDAVSFQDYLTRNPSEVFPLAEIDSPGVEQALIQVWAVQSSPDTSLERFFTRYAKALKSTIVASMPEQNGRLDAIVTYNTVHNQKMMARSTVYRTGNYIVWLNSAAPEIEFAKYAETYGLCANTFQPSGINAKRLRAKVPEITGDAAAVER